MAAPEERPFPGHPRPMPDTVDYRFRNGWTQTGDLPCREALRALLPGRRVVRPGGPFEMVHLGLDGDDIDFSVFRTRPTLIVYALRCRLRADADGRARLGIETCGGVRLWLGSTEVAAFEPFDRNRRNRAEIGFAIGEGVHDLTLRLEDLHERDTECLARIDWLDGPPCAVSLPDGLTVDVGEARELAAALSVRPVHEGGPIRLTCDPPPRRPVGIAWTEPAPYPRGGIPLDPDPLPRRRAVLSLESPAAEISASPPAGCLSIEVEARLGSATVRRRLGTTVLPDGEALSGEYGERRDQAASLIARARAFDPSVVALMACRNEGIDYVRRVVAAALDMVEAREDCADFAILPLLRIWRDGRGALPPALAGRLRRAILGFRYWMTEPGDDVMWFWSENHVLCFHAAQAVAGALFPGETFTNSGRTGADLAAEAESRLHRWFDAAESHGLCEWNSAAYYPIDLLGLLTLHDMVPALRARAAALMDRIFAMTALHASGGVPAGSQGRCYEKELLAGPLTELGSVAAIAFGGRFVAGHDRAAALLCLSDYVPPPAAAALAAPDGEIEARYTQGLDHAGRLTLWKSAEAQLSTATGHVAGARGHQAHLIDLRFAVHPMARAWINHPGEARPWGERRPSLLAGNHVMPRVAQHGPTALMIYDLERPWAELPFTQLYAGAMERGRAGDWHLLRLGGAAAAVWCSSPLEETAGMHAGALRRAAGPRTGWVLTVKRPRERMDAFVSRLGTPRFDAAALELTAPAHDGRALHLAHDGAFSTGGRPRPFAPLSPEPHVSMDGGPLRPWKDA